MITTNSNVFYGFLLVSIIIGYLKCFTKKSGNISSSLNNTSNIFSPILLLGIQRFWLVESNERHGKIVTLALSLNLLHHSIGWA